MNKTVSPSRTYVAMCSKTNFEGYYFRKFELPEKMINNTDQASWYFLNKLDFCSCIDGCITVEDYLNIKDADILEVSKQSKTKQNVVIGRIVRYVSWTWEERPAIIVKVWNENMVNLQVFFDTNGQPNLGDVGSQIEWKTSVMRDDGIKLPGTWHFPGKE